MPKEDAHAPTRDSKPGHSRSESSRETGWDAATYKTSGQRLPRKNTSGKFRFGVCLLFVQTGLIISPINNRG